MRGRALRGLLVALSAGGRGAALSLERARGAPAVQAGDVNVAAAASLTGCLRRARSGLFESQNPGSRMVFNFGPSSGLRTQIEQGAPADVFASADQAQMDLAKTNGVIAGDPQVFARNALVLVLPRDNPGRITSLQDLARPGLRLVSTAPQVPIGAYTRQMLQTMSQDPMYGADFADRVLANVRSEELDVRALLNKIVLGEGDGGVVYATDVTQQVAPEVQVVQIPEAFNVIASLPDRQRAGRSSAGARPALRRSRAVRRRPDGARQVQFPARALAADSRY